VRDDRDIADLQDDRRQHSDHAIRANAALHEDHAETGHEPAESGIPQHHFAVAHPLDHLPIGTYMVHAVAYLAAMQQQGAVIRATHQPVNHWAKGLQLQVHIWLGEDVQRAWYHCERDQ